MESAEVDARPQAYARGADLGWVAEGLTRRRHEILGRWLDVTCDQDFHDCRHEEHVSDHIPALFDALVAVLRRDAPPQVEASRLLDDPAVLNAAREHARVRFEQGLRASEVVTEFRLLRQEFGRALRLEVDHDAPAADVVAAEILVNDALDGAITIALDALTRRVEEFREEFFATTVHDVQQPLTGARGHIQLARRALQRSDTGPPGLDDLLSRAEADTERMRRLLGILTDASRLALGHLAPKPAPTSLVALVREAVNRLDARAAARIRLAADSDDQTTGSWDGPLLERVVDNLLSNAVKYAPDGGSIEVDVRREGARAHLSVRDRGIGLTPDDLAGLFRRYGRASGAVERGIEGVGLGLFLSRGIVEAHGGRIWAESPGPGRGATMHVVLPRPSGAQRPVAAEAGSPPGRAGSLGTE